MPKHQGCVNGTIWPITQKEYVRNCKHNPNHSCPLQKPKCECCSIRWEWEREIRNEED